MSGSPDMDFFQGLALMDAKVQESARKGVGEASLQWLDDSINQSPRIPHDEGTLQGSGSVFVGNELIAVAPNVGGDPTPAREYGPPGGSDDLVGTVGFNTPYAAYQHEGARMDGTHPVDPGNYTRQDGRGPKYMEKPMVQHRNQYFGLVAKKIKRVLGQ